MNKSHPKKSRNRNQPAIHQPSHRQRIHPPLNQSKGQSQRHPSPRPTCHRSCHPARPPTARAKSLPRHQSLSAPIAIHKRLQLSRTAFQKPARPAGTTVIPNTHSTQTMFPASEP
jgi:hypothetical protein